MKMPARRPFTILGAASAQTREFRGDIDRKSGSTSPKMRTSRFVSLSRRKKAVLSIAHFRSATG